MSPSRPAATRHWAGSECEKALLGRGAFSGLGRFDAPAAVWRDILGGRDVVEEVGCCDRRAGWCAWPEHELEFWQRGNPLGVRAPYTGAILPWRRRPPWFGVSRPDLPPLSVAQQSFCQSAGRSWGGATAAALLGIGFFCQSLQFVGSPLCSSFCSPFLYTLFNLQSLSRCGRGKSCRGGVHLRFRQTGTSARCAWPRSGGCFAVSDEHLPVYSVGPKCSLARAPILATVFERFILSQPRQRQNRPADQSSASKQYQVFGPDRLHRESPERVEFLEPIHVILQTVAQFPRTPSFCRCSCLRWLSPGCPRVAPSSSPIGSLDQVW